MNAAKPDWVRFEWRLAGASFDARPPGEYWLRPAKAGDLTAMLAVVGAAYASDPAWSGLTASIEKRVGGRIRARLSDPAACFVVAEHDGGIAGLNGVAVTSPTNQHMITGVCVDPAHQGRGIGVALLARSLEWLRDQGVTRATVTTDATAAAARVYARFGATRLDGIENDDPPLPAASG